MTRRTFLASAAAIALATQVSDYTLPARVTEAPIVVDELPVTKCPGGSITVADPVTLIAEVA